MIRLDTTARSLTLFLGGAHATAPLQVVVSYSDQTSSTYLGGTQLSNSNGTSTVTICSAPSASTIRDIDMVSVLNTDTATQTVTIQLLSTATNYKITTVTLLVGEKLTFTHGSGWQVVSNSGSIKYTVLATTGVDSFSGGSTGLTPATATTGAVTLSGTLAVANGGTGTASPSLVAGTNVTITGSWPNQTVNSSTSGTVTSVTGTTGRVTSTGGTTPIIDLASGVATPGTTGSATLVPVVTIDTYGRVTSITTAANPQGTVTSVTGTAPVVSSGGTTPAISMAAATTSVSGYLTSTDWNTFNNKGSGTVTSVSGTTGNITSTGGATPVINLASGVATAGTTGSATLVPVVTIDTYGRVTSITTAANPQGTVTSVTGTSPIVSSGGATPAISLAASYGDTQNPYASKTANYVLAAPNGTAGVPTFRAIVAADIPTLNQNTSGTASNVTGTVAVVNGGTGATTASGARSNLSAAQSGANTDLTSVALTTGTVSTAPSSSTDIVNKSYADSISTGINFHAACSYATTAALGSYTYSNGTSGVGATLTGAAVGTLTIDGYTFTSGDVGKRILIKSETGSYVNNTTPSAAFNGIYTLTTAGTGSVAYVLTRATDYDTSGSGTNEIDQGDMVLVLSGTTNTNTSWVQQTLLPITLGTTSIVFIQFAAVQTYTAGTGLTLATNQFSITSTGTAGTYGSASQVPVFVTNAQGQVTSVTNTVIAISGSAVTGNISGNAANVTGTVAVANGGTGSTTSAGALTNLGAYAASNPSGYTNNTGTVTSVSATVPTFLSVSGSPITTSGTLAISYSGTALPIANGGSGQTTAQLAMNAFAGAVTSGSYLRGNGTNVVMATIQAADVPTLNQNTTGSAGSVANALTSGTGISFSSGTTYNGSAAITVNNSLPMVYPGAGIPNSTGTAWGTSYSTTGSGTVLALATSPSFTTPILGTPTSGNFSSGSFTWPTFNQNTTGNAATATSATTATNIAAGANLQIPYNTGSGATSFIAAPTLSSTYLSYNGTGFAWASAAGLGTVTSVAASVPSFLSISGSPITTAGTLAISYSGTALPIANGGTGQTTATAAFNALSPITTTGDLILGNGTNSATRLGIGANTYVLTSNGTTATWAAASGGGGSGLAWQSVQTANFTAVSGNAYPINTTSGGITATLPASPAAGNYVCFTDYAGTFATNFLQVNPNGNKIDGNTSSVSITQARESIHLVYIDATQGWIPYAGFNTVTPVTGYPVEYLVVAGGAGGGANIGGGGGAGGYQTATGFSLNGGVSYTVTVGAGGAAGVTGGSAFQGGTGSNSVFSTITSTGGGGGGYATSAGAINGTAGGSGGGGGSLIDTAVNDAYGGAGTSGQGNRGGNVSSSARGSGGGGGASAAGGDTSTDTNGAGGAGTASSISGSSLTYAGGGGGGGYPNSGGAGGSGGGGAGGNPTNGTGTAGTANTGGGGGGGGGGAAPGGNGAAGGSGIVVIKYIGAQRGTGGTVTSVGGYTIHTFTSSGTYVA